MGTETSVNLLEPVRGDHWARVPLGTGRKISARIYQARLASARHQFRKHSTFTNGNDIPIGAQVKASIGSPGVKLALDLQPSFNSQGCE